MKKKIFPVLLALLLCIMPTANAFAQTYTFELDIKVESDAYQPGDSFWVTIYVNKISNPLGLIGLDLLTKYDSSMLTANEKVPIYPASWEGDGDDFSPGQPNVDTSTSVGQWNTVLVYEGNKMSGVGVTSDNSLGVKIKFTVNNGAKGNAKIWVDTDSYLGGTIDYDPVTQGGLIGILGKGASVTVNIGGTTPSVPSDEPQSQSPTSAEPTSEVSELSEEPSDNSDDQSTEEPISDSPSQDDSSADVISGVTSDVSVDNSIASEEMDESKADDDKGGLSLPAILGIVVAVVAISAVVAVFALRKKNNATEE